jgi:hypothetical protein
MAASPHTAFADRLRDPLVGWAAVFEGSSDRLLIVFAGIRGEVGIPSYDFLSISSTQAVKRLFLRDHHRAWYQRGVAGLAGSAEDLAEALRRKAEEAEARHVAVVGNSAGGYAALLFGGLIGADACLAFSARTFFGWPRRIRHRDRRYLRDAVRVRLSGHPRRPYRDLRAVPLATRNDLHYSTSDRLDTLHARRMAGITGMHVHAHPGGGHQLVRELRDRGELGGLLAGVLGYS